jgi:hypothetical protein
LLLSWQLCAHLFIGKLGRNHDYYTYQLLTINLNELSDVDDDVDGSFESLRVALRSHDLMRESNAKEAQLEMTRIAVFFLSLLLLLPSNIVLTKILRLKMHALTLHNLNI